MYTSPIELLLKDTISVINTYIRQSFDFEVSAEISSFNWGFYLHILASRSKIV